MWGLAAEAERRPGILDASPLLGFAWADSPGAGPGVMVWAEEHLEARATARALADQMDARRWRMSRGTLPWVGEAVRQALASATPVALLEPSDDPLLGGGCDAPALLRALVEAGPPVETAFLYLHDPEAVRAAREAGIGGAFGRPLGARLSRAHGEPVVFHGIVERLTAGRFLLEGPAERGAPVDLGPTAVLRRGRLRVVVTTRREADAAGDAACLTLHGIVLAEAPVVALKASVTPGWAAAGIAADTPGPCAAPAVPRLPFQRVPQGWRG